MRGAHEGVDDLSRAPGLVGAVDPDLRQRRVDRQLAHDARGVRVEDARANAPAGEEVQEELGLRKVGGGEDAFQKRYEIMPLTASWLIPERPDTFAYARLRPMRSINVP